MTKFLSRKFILSVLGLAVITVLLFADKITADMFTMYFAGIVGVYGISNAIAK